MRIIPLICLVVAIIFLISYSILLKLNVTITADKQLQNIILQGILAFSFLFYVLAFIVGYTIYKTFYIIFFVVILILFGLHAFGPNRNIVENKFTLSDLWLILILVFTIPLIVFFIRKKKVEKKENP